MLDGVQYFSLTLGCFWAGSYIVLLLALRVG